MGQWFDFSHRSSYYMISFRRSMIVVSNAPYYGGGRVLRYVNRTVQRDYNHNPREEIASFLSLEKIPSLGTIVTLTAVDVTRTEALNVSDQIVMTITCGTENALSIGSMGKIGIGTINVFVAALVNLKTEALLDLFQGVVEAKCQALNDLNIRDRSTNKNAPGTSTDTVTLCALDGNGGDHYGGRLTWIGKSVSVAVYDRLVKILSENK
ncbi:MAG: adenosylcobinamide amidohydrolase [Thermoplasmataceae archaeon]